MEERKIDMSAGYPKVYADALAAVRMTRKQVTPEARAAVKKFLKEITTSSGAREQHFRTRLGTSMALTNKDSSEAREARCVSNNLNDIIMALEAFATDRRRHISRNLKEPVRLFVKRWAELAKIEHSVYETLIELQKNPEFQKAATKT